jgi:endonuclease/exonuclease/phosphatase family metal-dependent hydrolase
MKLRVLTYNIHRAIGVDRRFRPERIHQILSHYDADVVLLQEVDDGVPRSREMNLAKTIAEELQYPHFALGRNHRLKKGSYGNATLSRFPIVRQRNIDLTIGEKKRRGCQHTTLDLGNDELEVFNLHLGLSGRERESQIGILVRSSEFPGLFGTGPCLVAGDFNDWRSRIRPVLTEVFRFSSATERRSRWNRAIPTYPSLSPRGALDRVYYRGIDLVGARRCRLSLSRVASDHLPVIADFVVGNSNR